LISRSSTLRVWFTPALQLLQSLVYVPPESIPRRRGSDAELFTNFLPIVPQHAHPDYGTTSFIQVRKQLLKVNAPVYFIDPAWNCSAFLNIRSSAGWRNSTQSASPPLEFLAKMKPQERINI
jgi:hypothetical protein